MVLYQMNLARFVNVYFVMLGIGIVYFIFSILILKRSRKRLNQLFSTFYILAASGTVVNVIYASLFVNPLVKILHFITMFLYLLSPIYLLIVCLIILKSEKVVSKSKQNIIAFIYGALLMVLAPIAFFMDGVIIDESTNWKPVWSLLFTMYALILISLFIIIPFIYLSTKIYKEFEDKILRKRWLFFNLGVLPYFGYAYIIMISNLLNDPTFRIITSIVGLSLYAAAFLLYYGIGRQIKK